MTYRHCDLRAEQYRGFYYQQQSGGKQCSRFVRTRCVFWFYLWVIWSERFMVSLVQMIMSGMFSSFFAVTNGISMYTSHLRDVCPFTQVCKYFEAIYSTYTGSIIRKLALAWPEFWNQGFSGLLCCVLQGIVEGTFTRKP